MLDVEDVININRKIGGEVVQRSSLEFPASICKESSDKHCLGAWLRAILIDHPFSDGNKRTALALVEYYLGVEDEIDVAKALIKIARERITDTEYITEVVTDANRPGD